MEEKIPRKQVKVSDKFYESVGYIYDFGFETFGYFQAERYKQKLRQSLDMLSCYYTYYPECRHLATKSRMYRNIILDAHLIIYRITDTRIEVLILFIPHQVKRKYATSEKSACKSKKGLSLWYEYGKKIQNMNHFKNNYYGIN